MDLGFGFFDDDGLCFFCSVCFLFVLAFFGVLYPYGRGIISTSLVVLFVLTAPVAGYSAASFFGKFSETGWVSSFV